MTPFRLPAAGRLSPRGRATRRRAGAGLPAAGAAVLAALAGLCVAAPSLGLAQSAADRAPPDARRDEALIMLENQSRRGRDVDDLRRRLITEFQKSDLDGGGVGPSDARLQQEQAAARGRLRQIQDWLRHDLDGDGRVAETELRRALSPMARRPLRSAAGELEATEEQVAETLDRLVGKAARFDRNGDGFATFEEALATVRADAGARFDPRLGAKAAISTAYDLDGDGVIRRDEFLATFDLLIAEFDADGDGRFSTPEQMALRNASREASRRKSRARAAQRQASRLRRQGRECGFTDLPDAARLTVLTLTEGAAIPTARVRDPRATTLADLVVEPGEAPLYLVIAAETPMLLRFSGAVERVSALVLAQPHLAAFDLERARISWLDPGRCAALGGGRTGQAVWGSRWIDRGGASFGRPPEPGPALERLVTVALGRAPDQAFSLGRVGRIAAPSGAPAAEQSFPGARALDLDGAAGALWTGFLERFPGGLVDLDPADGVGVGPLVVAAPPPGRAGLARLVEDGALRLISEEGWGLDALPTREDGALLLKDAAFFDEGSDRSVLAYGGGTYRRDPNGDWRRWRPPVFEVLSAFKAPAGLEDLDQVVFQIREGGPAPQGPLGDSTLETIAGAPPAE